jgi:hypothetical protein
MLKKIIDVISLASIAVFFGVAVWLATWGEGPRAPGQLSIQSKMVLLDAAPVTFGFIWLIFRYARAAVERFPRVFGPRGLLFYFVLIFGGGAFVLRWCVVILSKLSGG